MSSPAKDQLLIDAAPELALLLTRGRQPIPLLALEDIRRETVFVTMRDGIRLATDLYIPPQRPAPVLAVRTPYGRAHPKLVESLQVVAQQGYAIAAQDCRGTGESEPDEWDYYVHEREDSFDLVEWISQQLWFGGFLAGFGSSYLAQTQWCMALHPRMSAIVPEVGGLGAAYHTARLYMFLNAFARSVGKGSDKVSVPFDEFERMLLPETLEGGFFNEPLHKPVSPALLKAYPHLATLPPRDAQEWLWAHYGTLGASDRARLIKRAVGTTAITIADIEALPAIFGQEVAHDAHMFACPSPQRLAATIQATPLIVTGWYDWGLNDALSTWHLLQREGAGRTRQGSRLIITPSAHNTPGYQEGKEAHPELGRTYRMYNILDVVLHWYHTVRTGALKEWPRAIYYLMGANEWRAASAWPPPGAYPLSLYLDAAGALRKVPASATSLPDHYTYDPYDPPPTVGGSIVSYVYPPGSVDTSSVQRRKDVLTYTTDPLDRDLDVVGPLRLILFASSTAVDTDFSARLTDVFPDGRAIQLQSGLLRARYRDVRHAELLEPDLIYRLEIDMWATANRFRTGHRLRLDISSADFPRFDRNANRGGFAGPPVSACQTIYHDDERPSHLILSVLPC